MEVARGEYDACERDGTAAGATSGQIARPRRSPTAARLRAASPRSSRAAPRRTRDRDRASAEESAGIASRTGAAHSGQRADDTPRTLYRQRRQYESPAIGGGRVGGAAGAGPGASTQSEYLPRRPTLVMAVPCLRTGLRRSRARCGQGVGGCRGLSNRGCRLLSVRPGRGGVGPARDVLKRGNNDEVAGVRYSGRR